MRDVNSRRICRGGPAALAATVFLAALAATASLARAEDTAKPVASPVSPSSSTPPNVILLFADDLGYGDLGCYGGKAICTPNLDRLAAEGLRMTDFYAAAPFCSPSRASILTGRYPIRAGVPNVLFPQEQTGLPAEEVTLAELLRARGYATACIGKWHLGTAPQFRPTNQGFDSYFGLPYSNDSRKWDGKEPFRIPLAFTELPLLDGDRVVEAPVDQTTLTIRYTRRALKFIERNRQRPFFLYLPHTFPHSPQYASKAFDGKSPAGIYADSVEELDWSVGQVIERLRELDLAGKTLVVFTSDNGPTRGGNRVTDGKERWHGGSPGPLRGFKGQTFEGGMRVPAIFWWPGHIEEDRTSADPASLLDVLPTVASLTGADLPADRVIDGRDLSPVLLHPGETMPQRLFCYYFADQLQAVREGRWKLILPISNRPPMPPTIWYRLSPRAFDNHYRLWPQATLYDLQTDIGETTDVAAQHPQVVQRLLAQAEQFDRALQADKRPMVWLEPAEIPETANP